MKHLIWLLSGLLILSCSRGEDIRVTGYIENGDRTMIYLDEQGLEKIRKVDSTKLKRNGRFVLKDRISVPTFYNLHLGDQNIIPLLILPGDFAEIRTSHTEFANAYELNGSLESKYLLELNQQMAKTRKSLDSLSKETPAALQAAYSDIVQSQRRYNIEFVLEHLNSMAAIYALYQKIDDQNFVLNSNRDIQLLKITSAALDTLYPESEYVKSLTRDAANLEQELIARSWQSVIKESTSAIPEIRLPDPYGDTIALSSLRGKVVLLSFWASWHKQSIDLNQDFKWLFDKYHSSGLEVYQVSFDTKLSDWMAAMDYDELSWINVSELTYPQSAVAHLYNVTELPTFFLIDRQGQITGKNYDLITLDRKISELINLN